MEILTIEVNATVIIFGVLVIILSILATLWYKFCGEIGVAIVVFIFGLIFGIALIYAGLQERYIAIVTDWNEVYDNGYQVVKIINEDTNLVKLSKVGD